MGGPAVQQARRPRKSATVPERTLWKQLRGVKSRGAHFRRQVPLGPYFADFACHTAKLVIEVDGHLHGSAEAKAHDATRTRFIEQEGYQVLRFSNADIATNLGGVFEVIQTTVDRRLQSLLPPTPAPPQQGEGSGEAGSE